jgi:hypothetical protein
MVNARMVTDINTSISVNATLPSRTPFRPACLQRTNILLAVKTFRPTARYSSTHHAIVASRGYHNPNRIPIPVLSRKLTAALKTGLIEVSPACSLRCNRPEFAQRCLHKIRLPQINRFQFFARQKIIPACGQRRQNCRAWRNNPAIGKPFCHFRPG